MNEAERFLKEQMAKRQGVNEVSSQSYLKHRLSAFKQSPSVDPSTAYTQSHMVSQFIGQQYCVSLGEAIKRYWTNWSLNGRTSRSEYWFAMLGLILIAIPFIFFALLLGGAVGLGLFQLVWGIATLWPSFAIAVRRLHDIGKTMALAIIITALPILSPVIMVIGGGILGLFVLPIYIWFLYCMGCQSQMQENQYGPVPNVNQ